MGHLVVKPVGHIKSGYLDYSVEGDTLSINGSVSVKLGFFGKTFDVAKSFTGQPGQFKKKAYKTPGAVQSFPGNVSIMVLDCDGTLSHCHFNEADHGISGVGTLDVSGDEEGPVVVKCVHGQGSFHGITQEVIASDSDAAFADTSDCD